jgi:hypothetical protein
VDAVKEVLSDNEKWRNYRKCAYNFAQRYTSQAVFDSVLGESEKILNIQNGNSE